jgi:beta-glucosidase-like glycosyl hydrolase
LDTLVNTSWVEETLNKLPLEALVGQLFVVRTGGFLLDHQNQYPDRELNTPQLIQALELGVGGILIFGGAVGDTALKIQWLQQRSQVPLLVCSDVEGGLGEQVQGGSELSAAMGLGATGSPALVEQAAYVTGIEAKAIGINWVLGPVADVNSNPANPVIGARSFGADPEQVADCVAAYLKGLHRAKVLGTVKHFPGHGDTDLDSHLDLPPVQRTLDLLDTTDWVPFKRAITEGTDGIMSAHLTFPLIPDSKAAPATFSPYFLTEILRKQWSYDGLIVTDALTMQAITDRYSSAEASLRAFQAGADILLMPQVFPEAHQRMCKALRSGEISMERLKASVRRILEAKAKVGFPSQEPLLDSILKNVSIPEHRALAQTIAQRSICRLNEIPLPNLTYWKKRVNIVVVDSRFNSPWNEDSPMLTWATPDTSVRNFLIDPNLSIQRFNLIEEACKNADGILIHILLETGPYAGRSGLPRSLVKFFQRLLPPQIYISYTSPYLLMDLPSKFPAIAAFGQNSIHQEAVLAALNGETELQEHHSFWLSPKLPPT